jgi:hypothetical protein
VVGDEPPLTAMTSTTTTTMKANTTTGTHRARYQERRAGDTAVKLLGVGAAQGRRPQKLPRAPRSAFWHPTRLLDRYLHLRPKANAIAERFVRTYLRHGVLYGARNAAGACVGRNAPLAKTTVRVNMTGTVSLG